MTLLAAWAVLLGRLSEEQDVVIGTPVANRVRVEIEGLIGFFVNTLAVRVDLSGRPTVAEMLQRVKRQALTAQQHQDIPFEQVVELVQPVRSLAHSPLFQVMFALQSGSQGRFELAGLEMAPLSSSPLWVSKFDLTLVLQDSEQCIEGQLEYSTALFDRQTVERYAGYYERLLEGMIAAGEGQAVDAVALLSEAERRQVVYEWNQSETVLLTGCVHELFEEQAEKTPEAVAVESGEGGLSYTELNARSNRLAHYLRRSGVGMETRVGVCMERSVEMVVALLGILKAGGAYVPLDAKNPAAQLALIIEDAEVGMVVIQSQLRDALPVEATQFVPLVCVDDDWEMIEEESTENIGLATDNNQLAYVMYTSGTTGQVKGVLVTHRNAVGLVRGSRYVGLDRGAVVGQVSKLVFAASTFEIWSALLNGHRLAIVGKVAEGAEEELRGELRDLGVSTLYVSTAMYQESVRRGGGAFAGVEQVLFGGEACDGECVRRGVAAEGTGEVVHVYGATETTGMAMCGLVNGVEERKGVLIGRAIGNSATYIVDGELEAVGVGVRGDIFVAGTGIARGYEKQAEETAERFVPDPYRGEFGARMYRTGDVGRWDRTGEIEFLWRRDHHGELAGKRIELGKIEARLKEHRRIAETAVVVREDGGGEGLVAYYTLAERWDGAKEGGGSNGSEGGLEAEELRAYLKAQLPEYMVPAKYMCLERMPRNGNGKVDRERLPRPEEEAFVARGYEAPEGELESVVAKIWAEVLQVERVGRQDNFFELGGRSLLAVQVAARMRQALSVEIGITDLFVRPVLSDFARALEGARPSRLPAITRAERTEPIPLSFAQQRLWFLAQMEGASGAYHMPFGVLLQGKLDGVALRRALDRIVARHEGLRTSFVMAGGEPQQHITAVEESCFYLLEHDLRQHQDARSELEKLIAEEADGRFDLEKGPLIRGRLIHMAEEEHAFLITMHHIVSDEWSMAVMIRELQTLYAAFVRGEEDSLPALAIQYADYSVWQRKWIEGEILQEQAEYWKKNLAGASELLEVPADHVRPRLREYRGGFVEWIPGNALTGRLKGLSRRQGTTLYMTVLGGWAALLGRLTGDEDVVVGTQVANRGQREIEGVIGFFVNTLAMRLYVSRRQNVGAMLAGVKKQVLEGQEHQDIPFEHVVEIVQPVRSLRHSPVFQVSFAWQNAREGQLELPGLEAKPLPAAPHMAAKFDMTIAMWETEEDLTGGLEYATSLYGEETAQRYLGYLQRLLEGMVENEEAMLGSLPLLSGEERDQIVYEWNQTSADYPRERCLHELFEEQVKRTPEAIAVVYEGASLSYGELNRRANQLGHYLRRMGVGPETVVGICLERSLAILVGVLGILKAGGAYMPLDPDYPRSRVGYMLENAKTGVVVTEERLLNHIPEPITRICLDGDWKQLATENDQNPEHLVTAENLAYIIYTSGSTGNAKGVMIPHCNLVTYALWANGLMFDVTVEIVPVVQALSFDGSIKQLLSPLLTGLAIWVLARKDVAEPGSLIKALSVRRHLRFCAVPTLWTAILDAVESGQAELPPDMIAKAFIGGEELTKSVVERSFKFLPRLELWNFYGPTETTGSAATTQIRSGDPVTIGRAIAGKRIYILDPEWQLAPRGVVGELFIGGAGVARGYLNRPELTAERFVPDPCVSGSGARLYKSGDLGKWRADGNIEFLGRNDFQVKIRGFRMELGEIEARLMQHEGVSNAVVVVREDAGGDKRLVAYYTAAAMGQNEDGCAVGAEDLRDYLSQSLPEYMVPVAYVALAAIPLTPNGKLDKKGLPAPQAEAYAVCRYEPPQGEIETALARIWSKVLKVERIGRNDNFFRLGGHSFVTIQVVNLLAKENIKILSLDLFAHPTIESLAAKIELQGGHTSADHAVCIRKGGLEAPLFLVHDGLGELVYGPALSSCVDVGIPIYGLPAAPLDHAPMRTMEGMAIRMVRMIREVQPAGPYRLSGWSFGGVLAYEIATQLIGADQVVEFLGLFDSTYLPGIQKWSAPLAGKFDCKNILWELVERRTHNDPASRIDQTLQAAMARARAAAPDMDLPTLIRTCQEMSFTPPDWDHLKAEQIEQILLRIRSYHLALFAYSPQRIPVLAHLFTAQDNSFLPFLGWNAVLPENQIRAIPVQGTHVSMMATPNIEMLGQAVSCAIRNIALDSRALHETDYRPMTILQTGQRDTEPLFCVPGAGASVSSFIELVSKLNQRQRVHGFESRGLDGTLVPYSTVSTAAESYLRALQDVYPEGPVHLLGHSFGGWVAFEMANRLIERGRDVACLTILDSEAPDEDASVRELTHIEVTMAFINLFEELLEHPLGIKQSDLEVRSEKAQMELLHHRLVAEGLLPQRSQPDVLCGPLRTFAMAIRSSFNPNKPYLGAVQLVLVNESKLDQAANRQRQEDIAKKWKRWAPNLIHRHAHGNHMTVLKVPHVLELARLVLNPAILKHGWEQAAGQIK
jgi:amino acid adenylation domain-containing protein